MRKLLLVSALALMVPLGARAQSPVVTYPNPVTSVDASSTITVTNTFQSVFTAAGGTGSARAARQGCLIQNNGSNTMWVFAGPIANATKATSFQLIAPTTGVQGGSFSCATGGGGILQDQISITGTSGDAFTAKRQ